MMCPVCGGSASRATRALGQGWLECGDCGGAAASVARPAASDRHVVPEGPLEPVPAEVLEERSRIVRRMSPGRRVLDIGAGLGHFVEVAVSLGLDAIGVEGASAVREQAARRGVELHGSPLDALAPEFHAATMWDVLDRHPEPAALVWAARQLLVPGGLLVISTWNAGSLRARLHRRPNTPPDGEPAGLYHRITRDGLLALFDRAGLTTLKLETQGAPDLCQLAGERLAASSIVLSRPARWLLKRATAALRPACETWYLGDKLLGFARR